jgi:Cu/Ag efflux protein CusF
MSLSKFSVPAAVLAVLASAPALAQDMKGMNMQGMDMKPMAGQSQPITSTGVVKGVDAAKRRLNLAHDPIPAIGWPAMTMEFDVAKTVDLGAVKPGQAVAFTLVKDGGGYTVTAVKPKG